MKQKRITLIILVSISLCFGSFVSYRSFRLIKQRSAWGELRQDIEDEITRFNGEAGILIKDLNSGWEIAFNEDKLFASASVVKVAIMAACFYAASEDQIDLGQSIRLEPRHKVSGSGKLKRMSAGREFRLDELIELMVAQSDNSAANMLIELLGFEYLNDTFKKLGLKNSNISRKMMDFKSRGKGKENYTNCRDLAHLLEMIYDGRLINRQISAYSLELLKSQIIRDRIPAKLPKGVITAHKTGLEKGVCHDVGIVFLDGRNFLICALTSHQYKSAKAAKAFISEVALLTYNQIHGLLGKRVRRDEK